MQIEWQVERMDLILIGAREVGFSALANAIRQAFSAASMPTDFGQSIAAAAAIAYGSWLFLMVTAYFADILQATVLRGRKGAGWISFFFFLAFYRLFPARRKKLTDCRVFAFPLLIS